METHVKTKPGRLCCVVCQVERGVNIRIRPWDDSDGPFTIEQIILPNGWIYGIMGGSWYPYCMECKEVAGVRN